MIQSKHSSQRNHRFRTIHIRFHFATIVLLAVSLSSSPRKQPGASPTSHHQHCSPQPLQMDFQGTNRLPPSLFCIKNLPPNDGKVVIDGGSKAAPRRCSLCERCCMYKRINQSSGMADAHNCPYPSPLPHCPGPGQYASASLFQERNEDGFGDG